MALERGVPFAPWSGWRTNERRMSRSGPFDRLRSPLGPAGGPRFDNERLDPGLVLAGPGVDPDRVALVDEDRDR